MKRLWLSVAVLLALAAWGAAPSVSADGPGKIAGVVKGPSGPIVGVTVNIVDKAGVVVGTAVTTQTGAYTVGNLAVGNYTIQIVNHLGGVVVTGVGNVTAAAVAATVDLTLTAGQVAMAAVAAGGGAVGLGIATTTLVLTAAGVAGAGILVYVATRADSSPTR